MRLKGEMVDAGLDWMLIDVNGVGYKVGASLALSSRYQKGESVLVWTHEVIRDDSRQLFGFASQNDRELFLKLITVNGVGPKVGQKILGVCSANEIRQGIAEGSADFLVKVPGVGKKTAQKIVLELHGSISLDEIVGDEFAKVEVKDKEIVDALVSLGYTPKDAKAMAEGLPEDLNTLEEKVKAVLMGAV